MRQTTKNEKAFDRTYIPELDLIPRIIVRMFSRHIKRFCKCVLMRAYERSQIDSETMHEIAASVDRMLETSKHHGNVVQCGNICGGDMAGRDINK